MTVDTSQHIERNVYKSSPRFVRRDAVVLVNEHDWLRDKQHFKRAAVNREPVYITRVFADSVGEVLYNVSFMRLEADEDSVEDCILQKLRINYVDLEHELSTNRFILERLELHGVEERFLIPYAPALIEEPKNGDRSLDGPDGQTSES